MKVCCSSGKPYDTLTDFERLGGCGNDHCLGPIEVDDFDLLLTGLGTFNPDECISHEDLKHLFTTRCTQSCTNCNLMNNQNEGEIN